MSKMYKQVPPRIFLIFSPSDCLFPFYHALSSSRSLLFATGRRDRSGQAHGVLGVGRARDTGRGYAEDVQAGPAPQILNIFPW